MPALSLLQGRGTHKYNARRAVFWETPDHLADVYGCFNGDTAIEVGRNRRHERYS
jgi:hypothetical protein